MVVSRILQTSKKMKMNKVVSKKHRKLLKKQYVGYKNYMDDSYNYESYYYNKNDYDTEDHLYMMKLKEVLKKEELQTFIYRLERIK